MDNEQFYCETTLILGRVIYYPDEEGSRFTTNFRDQGTIALCIASFNKIH